MKACLTARVIGERIVHLRCDPPLSAKVRTGPDGPELLLVSSAANLLDRDRLTMDIDVREAGRLIVRTVAAQVAHPAPTEGTSLTVQLRVGTASAVWWRPQPLIACAGADHTGRIDVDLAQTARLVLRDELVLGRSGEDPRAARVRQAFSVSRSGQPVLVDGLDTTLPGAFGPAVLGSSRYVGTVIETPARQCPPALGWVTLLDGGLARRVLDPDPTRGRSTLGARATRRRGGDGAGDAETAS